MTEPSTFAYFHVKKCFKFFWRRRTICACEKSKENDLTKFLGKRLKHSSVFYRFLTVCECFRYSEVPIAIPTRALNG